MNTLRKNRTGLAYALLVALGFTLTAGAFADTSDAVDASASTPSASGSDATVAPQTADQLDATVAPIALYPDALVAQVLSASQQPDQIAIANYWLQQNKSLGGAALTAAVDQQSWDPSVKALTQFPAVLNDLATNLAWTSSLGEAFHYQRADVMAAVQAMRAKAQSAGNLKSTSQIKVVQQSAQTIVIQPASPDVVYVPQYNPTVVYGAPYVVPYYAPVYPATAAISFGAGVAIGAAIGGGFNWGFHAWGLGWGGGWGGGGNTIIFNHNTYINHTTWNGNRYNYNGYHPWGPHNGPYGPHDGPYGPHRYVPNGGHNGDHGLIGGNGGVEHGPNGGRNGDHGLIGGNGGVQHFAQDRDDANRDGERAHSDLGRNDGGERRSPWSADGASSRAESDRGRQSMRMHAAAHPHEAFHAPAHHGGGGGGHRR